MQLQVTPITPVVKKLLIANVVIWLVGLLIVENYFLPGRPITLYLGLTPQWFISDFFIWQPITYMFLHSLSIWHIVFNMLMLWWFGAELEMRWGSKFFLIYYISCGVGAGLIYSFGMAAYSMFTGASAGFVGPPVVGASGAIFGLLLAFGILFGERVVLFMFIFPMKMKYFVAIIGAIEIVSLLNSGSNNNVANLAHLGGLISGYIFLVMWTRTQQKLRRRNSKKKGRGRLKLVVNNESEDEGPKDGPKYWN